MITFTPVFIYVQRFKKLHKIMMKYNKKKRDVDYSLCQSGFRVICSQYTHAHKNTHTFSLKRHTLLSGCQFCTYLILT